MTGPTHRLPIAMAPHQFFVPAMWNYMIHQFRWTTAFGAFIIAGESEKFLPFPLPSTVITALPRIRPLLISNRFLSGLTGAKRAAWYLLAAPT